MAWGGNIKRSRAGASHIETSRAFSRRKRISKQELWREPFPFGASKARRGCRSGVAGSWWPRGHRLGRTLSAPHGSPTVPLVAGGTGASELVPAIPPSGHSEVSSPVPAASALSGSLHARPVTTGLTLSSQGSPRSPNSAVQSSRIRRSWPGNLRSSSRKAIFSAGASLPPPCSAGSKGTGKFSGRRSLNIFFSTLPLFSTAFGVLPAKAIRSLDLEL